MTIPGRLARVGLVALMLASAALAERMAAADEDHSDGQQGRAAISVVDNGPDASGVRRFNVQADGAELKDLLKALFGKRGDQFGIDQDVSGPVDLSLRDVTLDEAIQQIVQLARPPLLVRREGRMYHVSLAAPRPSVHVDTPDVTRPIPGALPSVPFGYQALSAANRPVTLEVSDDRPIPLETALARIGSQTGYPIVLDRRVPRTVVFSGRITRAPLGTVLQNIAETAGLKLVANPTQAYLFPSDVLLLKLNGQPLGSYAFPAPTCRNCGEPLQPMWKFCPHCGQAVGAARPPAVRGTVRKLRRP